MTTTKTTKIELRRITHNARLSQETNAFAADIYVDGKKVGTAQNAGHGGPTDYHITPRELREAIEDYAKSLPPVQVGSQSLPMDLEFCIDLLLEDYLRAKEDAKMTKRHLSFRLKGDPKHRWRQYKFDGGVYTKELRDFVVKKHGKDIEEILNDTLGQVPQ